MDMETWTWKHGHGDMETSIGKWKPRQVFLNLFTVCSWCKQKFVVCPLVDEETNRSYPIANGLNGLAHL
jgi:hypothetical protein